MYCLIERDNVRNRKRKMDWMSGESGYPIELRWEEQNWKEETTNWAVGDSTKWMTYSIARKSKKAKSWNASWAKGEIGLRGKHFKPKCKKVFIKGWTNHNAWSLVNAGAIYLKSWWKLTGKERNYQRYKFKQLDEKFYLIARKKRTKRPVRILEQRWRDLMEWQGKIN